MPESAEKTGSIFGSLPGWMGGKIIDAIARGNRTTNQEGIAAFQQRTRDRLKPPPQSPMPVDLRPDKNDPDGVLGGAIKYWAQQADKRKGKKPRMSKNPKKVKELSALQKFDLWYNNLPETIHLGINQALVNASELGQMPRTASIPSYRAPPIGSRSAQRGYVGNVADFQPAVTKVGAARPGRTGAKATRKAVVNEFDPKGDEELVPAVGPATREQQLDTWQDLQIDLERELAPVEVPARKKYGGLEPVRVTAKRVGAAAGRSPATVRPGGGTRTAGTATKRAPATAPGASRTSPRASSVRIGSFEIPIEPILRALTTRKPAQRPGRVTSTVTSPGTGAPAPAPQLNYFGGYASGGSKTCECEKPKKRKPRQPRTECRTGTYRQTSRGVKYSPDRLIPCT